MFPLPRGHFGDVAVTPKQTNDFRALVQERLALALADERWFAGPAEPDRHNWRRVRSKRYLSIYRRRHRHRRQARDGDTAVDTPEDAELIGFGRLQGSLEDALYGCYAHTHDELQATMGYLASPMRDCTVLRAIDTSPCEQDKGGEAEVQLEDSPMHYLGLHWLLTSVPMIKPRDWCYLQASGVARDAQEKRFGYLVMHSVSLSACPPFDCKPTSEQVLRGQLFFTFLLRESETAPGTVDVFSRGAFDAAGELLEPLTLLGTCNALSGFFAAVRCAEAKKLTLLAARHRREEDELENSTDAARLRRQRKVDQAACCAVCNRKAGPVKKLRMRRCRVCFAPVCSHCRTKKRLFTGFSPSAAVARRGSAVARVLCCSTCILAARTLDVQPSEPQFAVATAGVVQQQTACALDSHDEESHDEGSHDEDQVAGDLNTYLFDQSGNSALSSSSSITDVASGDVNAMVELLRKQKLVEERLRQADQALSSMSVGRTSGLEVRASEADRQDWLRKVVRSTAEQVHANQEMLDSFQPSCPLNSQLERVDTNELK